MGFYDMMTGWGGGWASWTMYLGMIAFWIATVALLVWGVRALAGGSPRRTQQGAGENAVEVLKRRYASGEIDSAEFQKKRLELM
jgi:putative membrane protein